VDKVNALEAEIEKLSDEELKLKTLEFRNRLRKNDDLNSVLIEAFAVVSNIVYGYQSFLQSIQLKLH
jgi:preprotein translocase subunit SecA